MQPIKLILVDDQVLFVESLKAVLESDEEAITVAGVAYDGFKALELVAREKPDMVLMDVRMPVMDGVEATKRIVRDFPDIKIIMLTTFDDDEYVHKAMNFGAVGYLLKNIPPHRLISSIRAVQAGSVLIAPGIVSKLLNKSGTTSEKDYEEEVRKCLATLGNREVEILRLMAQGFGNRQIVEKLNIAEQTVRNHVSMIYGKLGVRDRYEAIQIALKFGIS